MAQIRVENLTFAYEGSCDTVFENVSFHVDTSWKLGLIGRNGKGKTTLLQLLLGKYEYEGSLLASTSFDGFPYPVRDEDLQKTALELAESWKPGAETWQILLQMGLIRMDPETLTRPFGTLSPGEQTRFMLAVLFAGENEFLLIDEPTNHLDTGAREAVKEFLSQKKGFILVSHDRDLLDAVIDHVLVLNRKTIEVQAGTFSSWWANKEKSDAFAASENEKHLQEIQKLKSAVDRTSRWAAKSEGSKIGFDPQKEPDRSISSRSYIGAKTKKMQARVKSYEKRIEREIEEKEGLLKDIEQTADLKLTPLLHRRERLLEARSLSLRYGEGEPLFRDLSFEVKRGERIVLSGKNGCGKSSILKAILLKAGILPEDGKEAPLTAEGELILAPGLTISYVGQDTSFLRGSLRDFCRERGLNQSLYLAILRQLDLGREQFAADISAFSEGQKKKVLLAASLLTPAHLYIWDEPLNYIDVFSRMQIERLILRYQPTLLVVEHDVRFQEKIGTRILRLSP